MRGRQAEPEFELAASLAYIASKRKKAGFIRKRPVEQLIFMIKVEWPLKTLTISDKTFLFDPLGLFSMSLMIEPIDEIRRAMQTISGPIFSIEDFEDKLERALDLISEPIVVQKMNGLVPAFKIRDVIRELTEIDYIRGIKLQSQLNENEFLKQIVKAVEISHQLRNEVLEIKGYMESLSRLKSSWERELEEKEEEIRKTYETRIEDAKSYLGPRAGPEIEKLKSKMENEIQQLNEMMKDPLNLLNSLIKRIETARDRRESFIQALEEVPENIEFVVPFIVAYLSGKHGGRFLVIPPSNLSKVGIGGKLKKAFGAIVVPLEPRSLLYREMGELLNEEIHNSVKLSSYLSEIAKEENLVAKYSDLIMKGITRLRDIEILDEDDAAEVMSLVI